MNQSFRENYFKTSSLDFTCVLITLGFRLVSKMPMTRIISEDGSHRDTFYFQTSCETEDFGTLQAKQVYRAYREQESDVAKYSPDAITHIDYMRAVLANRVSLLECVKENVKPVVKHKVGEYECFMPLDASEELKDKMQHLIAEVV